MLSRPLLAWKAKAGWEPEPDQAVAVFPTRCGAGLMYRQVILVSSMTPPFALYYLCSHANSASEAFLRRNIQQMEGDTSAPARLQEELRWILQRITTLERRPPCLLKAWRAALQGEGSPTEKIFLEHGRLAWAAYYVSKLTLTQKTRYAGKAKLHKKIGDFENTSEDFRRRVASRLAETRPKEVEEKALRWLHQDDKASGRRRRTLRGK